MTQQPTAPWTPERAIQCICDWESDEVEWEQWRLRYEDGIDEGEYAQDLLARCVVMVAEAMSERLAEIERLKAELAKMTQQRDAYCKEMLDAKAQQQPEQCGAWGFCTLPVGHNMGRADIPENHQRPVAVPSDEEIAMAIKSVHMCGDTVTSSALRLLARRIWVRL